MSRKPSPETELRNLKRELREAVSRKDEYQREAMILRGKLNKSQAETTEWKSRFDLLLSRGVFSFPEKQDGQKLERCFALLRADPDRNYVPAVKLHRELFGSDLKAAVDVIRPEKERLTQGKSTDGGK